MSLAVPWLIVDADLALWPAWKDGMPFKGPGAGRDRPAALLDCKASLTITETFEEGAATGHGWTGQEMPRGSSYQITIDFPDGAVADAFGRLMSRAHAGGYRILTVRFLDDATGLWTLLSFFYVVPVTDAETESAEKMMRAFTVRSSFLQESVGNDGLPSLEPQVVGQVDWVCGAQRVTALEFDPVSETWTSLPRNETGDGTGSRYITLTPVDEDEGSDVILACYLPRFSGAVLNWQNTICLRVGREDSDNHHGLVVQAGHALQVLGIVEPLVHLPQARVIDEPVLHFRYLRRIYATLGHGVLAVPRLMENETPPVTHDPAFHIAATGPVNPETGNSGLVLLPNGAWLDGTVLTLP